jgi:hypothetical protein
MSIQRVEERVLTGWGMRRLLPEEESDGLRAALDAACRLAAVKHQINAEIEIWEWDGLYLAKVSVNGAAEWWSWTPGEPVFVGDEWR